MKKGLKKFMITSSSILFGIFGTLAAVGYYQGELSILQIIILAGVFFVVLFFYNLFCLMIGYARD